MDANHINNLPAGVLVSILSVLCYGMFHNPFHITKYWDMMKLATLCRLWNECMPQQVYRYVFVQRKIYAIRSSSTSRMHKRVSWVSNVGSILYQKRLCSATDLRIVMYDDYTGPLLLANALKYFGLTSPSWWRLQGLHFFGKGVLRSGTDYHTEDIFADAHSFSEFFARHFRNLQSIGLCVKIPTTQFTAADFSSYTMSPRYSMLLQTFLSKLSSLQCYQPSTLLLNSPMHLSLTHVELDMDCIKVPLPNIGLAPNIVERLKLYNIDGEVPLTCFRGNYSGKTIYTNLKEIQFDFRAASGSKSQNVSLCPHLAHVFPKLFKLSLKQSMGVYKNMYSALANAPLSHLCIDEHQRSLPYIDTSIIHNVTSFQLSTSISEAPGWYTDSKDLITRFYFTHSTVQNVLMECLVPFPTHILWRDLQPGHMIVHLLEQLPTLKFLRITCISMDATDTDNYFWGTYDRQADIHEATTPTVIDTAIAHNTVSTVGLEPINKCLQVLDIDAPGYFDTDAICRMPLFLPLLQFVAIDKEYTDQIGTFVQKIRPHVKICARRDVDCHFMF
ncbi:hypothetical protein DL89DRAFT_264544 [Linderina pennispora]|uniref:F-box domain-containing protein n=1 Tax=Linderina pennispora TaxID=61395 RepID=A0A1Y1WMF0_9FUNG|nr:uncharacterized protein DL89DRAFT_264544 [Linderina pennispora]ORX74740.1 hypothetical protein DL89DRAFT_264544 [Linderina pennispora]